MTDFDFEYDPEAPEPALLAFLRTYWNQQRGTGSMPRRQDISPAQMRAYLPHILLCDVVRGGEDFRYRLVGSELQRYFKDNPTGRLMSEALKPFGADTVARTIETYAAVVARHAPLRIRGAGSIYSQAAKTFDALLTPLSSDGIMADMILGTFEFVWDFRMARAMPGLVEPDEIALARALRAPK
ncbi:MAG TPA: PAS domain-containing protein [Rhizomicrobium sp.]|nr:PAS domain-containing protein [Rhizomicrobium sp.]